MYGRWRLYILALVTTALALLALGAARPAIHEDARALESDGLNVGFTFSPRQATYLDLSWRETFHAAMALSPKVVRLGAYWDEIERQPGVYDFTTLDWLLGSAAEHDLQVILTVGMKAPRWPEYYLPHWLSSELQLGKRSQVSDDERLRVHTLRFVQQVVERYRDDPSIAYWQVENEPLDPAGRHQWRIGADFLREEVDLVRALDRQQRPIIVSMFVEAHPLASLPPLREATAERAQTILGIADILGLDVYPSVGLKVLSLDLYFNWSRWAWEQTIVDLQSLAQKDNKQAWVLEAQAEPWEPSRVVYTEVRESRSVQPGTAKSTFDRLHAAGFQNILLWGVEHWYMRLRRHEDATWWETLGRVLQTATGAEAAPGDDPCRVRRALHGPAAGPLAGPCEGRPLGGPFPGLDKTLPIW